MLHRLSAVLPLTLVLALVGARGAEASTYLAVGTGDPVTRSCATITDTVFNCMSLRAAVEAANAHTGADTILMTAAPYAVTQAQLSVTDPVTITGMAARTTVIQGTAPERLMSISLGVQATISKLTLSGGNAGTGAGGALATAGIVTLDHVRITGGSGASGGGISNNGTLTMIASLIDHNTASADGGGVANVGSTVGRLTFTGHLEIQSSTLAFNTAPSGAGLSARGNPANTAVLTHITVARNTGGGVAIADAEQVALNGSLVAANGGANCGPIKPSSSDSIEDRADCAFGTSGAGLDLGASLVDAGGQTDVLTLEPTSDAIDSVAPCQLASDQRDVARPASACDAGAYEFEGARVPRPTPTSTPIAQAAPSPTPVPTATPTATPPPTPVFHKTVVLGTISGRILVRKPGSSKFELLDAAQGIPLGSTVDARHGVVELTSMPKAGGVAQKAKFWDGIFKVSQTGATTDPTLSEALAACRKASASAKKPKSRKLWGDGKGSFRTRGQYSAATVRGTKWLVTDSCAGTRTRVAQGSVNVRDNVRRKTIVVRAGKSYLARPRR